MLDTTCNVIAAASAATNVFLRADRSVVFVAALAIGACKPILIIQVSHNNVRHPAASL